MSPGPTRLRATLRLLRTRRPRRSEPPARGAPSRRRPWGGPPPCAATALLALWLSLGPRAAQARIPVCVRLVAPTLPRASEYERLLVNELRHHPTHVPATRGCAVHLILDYIRLARGAVLTGRLRGGVPHRLKVPNLSALPAKMREMVAFLLKREPVFLVEHLETSGLLSRPRLSLRRHGVNLYGVDVSELLVVMGKEATFLPGIGFRFRRAVDRWFLGASASVWLNPRGVPTDPETDEPTLDAPRVRFWIAARMEVGYAFLPDRSVSPYVSGLLGVSVSQLEAYNRALGGVDDLVGALGEVSVRLGLEVFRLYTVRADCHADVHLPLHKYRDPDYERIDAWTPSVSLGCGLAF